jgi:ribosome-associated protein
VLLDYVDIVVHVQHADERSFYGLERLWKDCPRIPFDAGPGDEASVDSIDGASVPEGSSTWR